MSITQGSTALLSSMMNMKYSKQPSINSSKYKQILSIYGNLA